ncbi:MAG: hypothetical protein ACKVQA_11115 [Burkholderiales bacterium]
MKFVGQLIAKHLARYPRLQLLDVYKLLHQAALGNSHAVSNPPEAMRRLEAELQDMHGPPEPLWEPISPDGSLVRVHLRPYAAGKHDTGSLAAAVVQTAASYPSAPDKLAKFCACTGDLASEGILPFKREEVIAFFDEIAEHGYPAVRHSKEYREAYKPSYRVVALELLPQAVKSA